MLHAAKAESVPASPPSGAEQRKNSEYKGLRRWPCRGLTAICGLVSNAPTD